MSVTLTVTDEELASTAITYIGEATLATYQKIALLDRLKDKHGEGKPSEDGGSTIVHPVIMHDHSSITQHSTGFEPVNLAVTDVLHPATYYWAYFNMPIAIAEMETKKNSGKAKVLDQLKARTMAVTTAFMRKLNRQLIKGDVTELSTLTTLNGIDYTTGVLEEGTFGSGQSNTVGGLSKTTYQGVTGWHNQSADIAGSFNSDGLAALDSMQVNCQARSEGEVDVILASLAAFKNTKRALRAQERYVDEKQLDGGRMQLAWGGAPIEVELEMPNGGSVTGVAGNNDEWSFAFLDLDNIHPVWHPDGYFELGPFQSQSGYDVRAAFMTCMVQLVTKGMSGSAVIIGGDTF